jgi:cysteinyl-tRNA synthetase
MKHCGEYLDIHCGGVDNIFPHHTNEIAQSEAYVGHKWCNYWVHVQHLNDERGKMSKSSGEFLTLALLESKGVNPLAYRLFCLQSHYRKPLVFSWETLANAEAAYGKLAKRVANLKNEGEADASAVAAYREKFIEAVGNDINTAQGITVLYDVLKDKALSDATKRAVIADIDNVLALDLLKVKAEEPKKETAEEIVPEEDKWIVELIAERKAAKKAKDFARADAIRDELLAKGVTLIDTREGTKYTKN